MQKRTVVLGILNKIPGGAGPHEGYTPFICNAESMASAFKQCKQFIDKDTERFETAIGSVEVFSLMSSSAVKDAISKYNPEDYGDDSDYGSRYMDAVIKLMETGKKLYGIVAQTMDLDKLISSISSSTDKWEIPVALV